MRTVGVRSRWAAAVLVALVTVTALGTASATGQMAEVLPPGDYTPAQRARAAELVQQTEEALPDFLDEATLVAQGFRNFGATAPGGWDHWNKPDRMADGRQLDPHAPETLVLRRVPEGYRVEAAMFYLEPGHTMENIPEDLAWLPGWHTHEDELCVDDDGVFTGLRSPGQPCFAGHPMVTPPMAHIWQVDNPCGHRFAGLGVGGIECGPHGAPHHPPHGTVVPGTMPPGPHPHHPPAAPPPAGGHDTGAHGPAGQGTAGHGTTGHGAGHDTATAPVAVRATPTYTG